MKSRVVAAAVLLAMTSNFVTPAVRADMSKDEFIGRSIVSMKENVMILGMSEDEAAQRFVDEMLANTTPADLTHYVYTHGSRDEREVFAQGLEAGFNNPKALVKVLAKMSTDRQATGANFKMSCGAGLGIGIPLMVAGIIVGIVGAAGSKSDQNEIKRRYIEAQDKATKDYLAAKASLEIALATNSQKIAVNQARIDELQRKIDDTTGLYTINDKEAFRAEIANLVAENVGYANNSGGISAQLVAAQAAFDQNMATLSAQQANELDEDKRKVDARKQLTLPGFGGALIGLPFILAGAKDCG